MKMKTKIRQKNMEIIICTHFAKMKLCAFIFAVFRNAIDCIIIERPLKDNIPDVIIIELFVMFKDSVFAPRVTSKMP